VLGITADSRACGYAPAASPRFGRGSPGRRDSFHPAQATEKALKGLLVLSGSEPPQTHVLARLHHLLEKAESPAPVRREDLVALQPFAVEERYPVLRRVEAERGEVEALFPAVRRAVDTLRDTLVPAPSERADGNRTDEAGGRDAL